MGLKVEDLEDANEEREKEMEAEQPEVPGQKSREFYDIEPCHPIKIEEFHKDYTLKEWLGFNYKEYVNYILEFVSEYGFDELRANNQIDKELGKLSTMQIERLRSTLRSGFINGESMRRIAEKIETEVKPGISYRIKDKEKVQVLDNQSRSVIIARTETVRAASEGALKHYKDGDIKKVRWVAALS